MSVDPLFRRIAAEQDAVRAGGTARAQAWARLQAFTLRRRRRRLSWVVSLVAASCALALFVFLRRGEDPLEIAVVGAARGPLVGVWLGAPEGERVPLRFSDGTRVELEPRSRARVTEVRSNGARVEFERGRLHVEVARRPAARWELLVGPFSVLVTGTRFDVGYSPESDAFWLSLAEGSVELSGCVFGKSRGLTAGQTVRASCRERRVSVDWEPAGSQSGLTPPPGLDRGQPTAAAALASGSRAEGDPSESSRRAAGAASSRGSGGHPELGSGGWVALARGGAYREAFAAADALGFSAQARSAGLVELVLLGDTARHAGASQRATEAFMLVRSRFPGTEEAALAAFALGRLQFDAFGAHGEAARWFRTYLVERPKGAVAREALGRLTEALHRSGDAAAAHDAAQRYLSEYPSGPHAELATRLLQSR